MRHSVQEVAVFVVDTMHINEEEFHLKTNKERILNERFDKILTYLVVFWIILLGVSLLKTSEVFIETLITDLDDRPHFCLRKLVVHI